MSRPSQPDHVIYSIWILWLIGFTEAEIADRLGLKSRKVVSGIVGRSDYANRSSMAIDERQAAYEALRKVRYEASGEPRDRGLIAYMPEFVRPLRPKSVR